MPLNFTQFQVDKTSSPSNINYTTRHMKNKSSRPRIGGLFNMFKLLPMLTTGGRIAALLSGHHRKPLLAESATILTLFGHRKSRLTLSVQEDPYKEPLFVIELPILTNTFHKEMGSDVLRIMLESETKTRKKKLLEEYVWAVYCNGRKIGYSIRRKDMTNDEVNVIKVLKGVSMGAGVLPSSAEKETGEAYGELAYIRARFDRVIGSKDSESFYMINPDPAASGQELTFFFSRLQ